MPSEISGKNWFYNSLDLHRVIANWYSRPNTLIPFEYIHILRETCMWEGGYGSQTLTELNFLTYTLFIMSHYIHTINILSAYALISETHIKYHTYPFKTLELLMWYERQKQINLNIKNIIIIKKEIHVNLQNFYKIRRLYRDFQKSSARTNYLKNVQVWLNRDFSSKYF